MPGISAASAGRRWSPADFEKTEQSLSTLRMPLSYDDAEFGKVRANGADKATTLPNQQVARPVQHQDGLLIRGFDWHEPHRWPLHGFGDRLSVGGVRSFWLLT